jgi:hypothetical protein
MLPGWQGNADLRVNDPISVQDDHMRLTYPAPLVRINELLVAHLDFAAGSYVNGHPTGELANMKDATQPVQALYETLPAAEFGPTCLRALRERMIENGPSRKVVNARFNRVRRIFKWGVEHELVAPKSCRPRSRWHR